MELVLKVNLLLPSTIQKNLTSKVPRPFFHQITLKIAISIAKSKNNLMFLFAYLTMESCTRLVQECVEEISKALTV